jgi:hypothetical protein
MFGIPLDKLLHLLAGATFFALLQPLGVNVAFIGVILLAAAKEVYDWLRIRRAIARHEIPTHSADPVDLLFTFLGALMLFIGQCLVIVTRLLLLAL